MNAGPVPGNKPLNDPSGNPASGDGLAHPPSTLSSIPDSIPGYGLEDVILKAGTELIKAGDPVRGIQALRDGLLTFPESVKLHYGLGRKLIGQHVDGEGDVVRGVLDEAVSHLERSLDLLDAASNRTELANQRDPIDETKYPDTLEVNQRYHLGLAYLFQGRFEEGAAQYKAIRELAPPAGQGEIDHNLLAMSANWEVVCLRAQGKFQEALAALGATPNPLSANLYRACGALVELSRHPSTLEPEDLIADTLAIAGNDKVDVATANTGVALHFILQVSQERGGVDLSGENFADNIKQLLDGHALHGTIIKFLKAACDPDQTVRGAWGSILARRLLKTIC